MKAIGYNSQSSPNSSTGRSDPNWDPRQQRTTSRHENPQPHLAFCCWLLKALRINVGHWGAGMGYWLTTFRTYLFFSVGCLALSVPRFKISARQLVPGIRWKKYSGGKHMGLWKFGKTWENWSLLPITKTPAHKKIGLVWHFRIFFGWAQLDC